MQRRRALIALALALALAAPATAAPKILPDTSGPAIKSLWEWVTKVVAIFDAARGTIEPDGVASSTPGDPDASSEGDSRGTMDPDG